MGKEVESGTRMSARVKKFKQNAMEAVERILRSDSTMEVVQTLALHLSTDCKLQQQLAYHWMQPICMSASSKLETELMLRINSLLTETVRLEVCAETQNRMYGTLYLFGQELAVFGIPFDSLRVNYVAYACVVRLMAQGHANEERRAFGKFVCSVNNVKSTWSEFGLNRTLQLLLARTPFVTSIVAYMAATALRSNAQPTLGVNAMQRDYVRAVRVVLASVLTESLSQIFGGKRAASQRFPWLDADCADELFQLRSKCNRDATFNVKELDALLMRQYARVCLAAPSATIQIAKRE
jgi:hypothetical protein